MREKERARSSERERDRSPMFQSERPPRMQPPDEPMADQRLLGEDVSQVPSSVEIMENVDSVPETIVIAGSIEVIEKGEEATRGKISKKDGGFTGEIAVVPREEDWMIGEKPVDASGAQKILSYREALKPRNEARTDQMYAKARDEAWDGVLVTSDEEEMRKGVVIKDNITGLEIEFNEDEKQRLARRWQNSLIIKLLGGTMGFMQMKRKVQTLWGKNGNVELSDIGNGYMIATFKDREDYFFALDGGPWIIQNHYLTVQTWKRNFNPWNESIRSVAVWVRLPGLPGDYYDRKFFYNLGNKIGRAIRVDEMTLLRSRTMYARMCVEIDLNTPLLPAYTVDGNKLKIEYEGLHLICFSCGKFGHAAEYCPQKRAQDQEGRENLCNLENRKEQMEKGEKLIAGEEDKYGAWMVVPEARRGRRTGNKVIAGAGEKRKEVRGERKSVVSRFAVLAETGEEKIGEKNDGDIRRPLQEISNVVSKEEIPRKGSGKTKAKVVNKQGDLSESKKTLSGESQRGYRGGISGGKNNGEEKQKKKAQEGECHVSEVIKSDKVIGVGSGEAQEKKSKRGVQAGNIKEAKVVQCDGKICGPEGDQEMEIEMELNKVQLGQHSHQVDGPIIYVDLMEEVTSVDSKLEEPFPPDPNDINHFMGLATVENWMDKESRMVDKDEAASLDMQAVKDSK